MDNLEEKQELTEQPTIVSIDEIVPEQVNTTDTNTENVSTNAETSTELPIITDAVNVEKEEAISDAVVSSELPIVTDAVNVEKEESNVDNNSQNEKIEIVEAEPSDVIPRTDVNSDQSNVVISSSINNNNNMDIDNNAIVNENLKKVEINYTPPSKFKVFLLIVFFVFLIGFVLFLPDITSFMSKYKSGELNQSEEKITTGILNCSLSTNTTNLDKNYKLAFNFTDSKLDKVAFEITTKGDIDQDAETLDNLAGVCKQLKENVDGMQGVVIQCDYTNGKLVEYQSFDLANVDSKELDSAFAEAGGNNPEYQYQQDIDRIERNMNASGYSCTRESK